MRTSSITTTITTASKSKYVYGELPDAPEGTMFYNREDLRLHGVHRPPMGGICGSAADAAESIVVSGGYEDDVDDGDEIIYTGQGCNDPKTGKQIADQTLARGNMGLFLAMRDGVPVRVIRGANALGSTGANGSTRHSRFAPPRGYRYDGLFRVEDCWHETGRSGFRIWRFRLRKIEDMAPAPVSENGTSAQAQTHAEAQALPVPSAPEGTERRLMTAARLIRNTIVALRVKELNDYLCQVCGVALETPRGRYAEAAHIQPLGAPHSGPDVMENILCLCPNHHLLFDYGAFTIEDDLRITGEGTALRVAPGHRIGLAYVKYHREHYG